MNNANNNSHFDEETGLYNVKDNIINIDDYECADEEKEMIQYTDLLNIFTIYYKDLFKKNEDATLLDEIDLDDISSTNRGLELFYQAVHSYKNAIDPRHIRLYSVKEYKEEFMMENQQITNDIPLYLVNIKESTNFCNINENNINSFMGTSHKITHNLVSALMYVSDFDWINCGWSIHQINMYN